MENRTKLSFDEMSKLSGGTDELGCGGIVLLGAVLSIATLGWGLFVVGAGLGICASEAGE